MKNKNKFDEQYYKEKVESLETLLEAYKVVLEAKDNQIKLLHEYIKKGIDTL